MRRGRRLKLRLIGSLCLLGVLSGCFGEEMQERQEMRQLPQKSPYSAEISQRLTEQKNKWHIGEPFTFNWYINLPGWKFNGKWTDYPILKDVSEITGAIPAIQSPKGSFSDNMNLMIASGTLPDMITFDMNDPAIERLIRRGLLYSYDELIDKYAPEFRDEIPEDVYQFTKSEFDGQLYGLPSFFIPQWRFDQKKDIGALAYHVRKDIYAELGSPDMSSPEGFIAALRSFKQKYPTLRGKPSIPLSAGENGWALEMLEESFGIKPLYIDETGKAHIKYKNPQFVPFITFANQLYREGLLDPDYMLKQQPQLEEDWEARVFAAPLHYFGFGRAGDKFVAIEPLQAVPGVEFPSHNRLGWTFTAITKNAKNPEALIKFARYMWSTDGNLLVNYGHERENYIIKDDGIERTIGTESDGIWTFRFFYHEWFPLKEKLEDVRNPLVNAYAADWSAFYSKINPPATSPEGIIETQMLTIIAAEYPKIITAEPENRAIELYKGMLTMLEGIGVEQLEQYYDARYKKNIKQFYGK
ncbi:extracellular solute-binding protein [Paenibacillus sp. GCM10027626]|uniref:extracellular solute-binding protein n=1 Tax=Paenibacillus sp. GCM10027626 TaxID=3273411 RepID=UPI00362CCF25